jgi:hypothetical protein
MINVCPSNLWHSAELSIKEIRPAWRQSVEPCPSNPAPGRALCRCPPHGPQIDNNTYVIDTMGSAFDTVLYVRDGITDLCNDDIDRSVVPQSRLTKR